MNAPTELLFLGLPETGKTTFLVALDEVLQSEQHGIVSNGFAANRTYLEKAKEVWRAGESISRTNLKSVHDPVELLVRHTDSGQIATLVAPDVHGEFYDDQWVDRKWPISYRDRLTSLTGIMVFVNALRNGRNQEMTAMWQSSPSSVPTPKPWEPRSAAEQVKLVDLLQLIFEYGRPKLPISVAVMISAWDLIEPFEAPKMLPGDYLKRDWALLHQYLSNNPEMLRSRVYGVSARGGNDAARAQLVLLSPQDRVWLKDAEEVTRDLTRPVRWLLAWP